MKKICLIIAIILILSLPVMALAADDSYSKGDSGDGVSQLQTWLRWYGYFNYRTTGRFSELTKKAVITFQSRNGLDASGTADEPTLALLYSSNAKPAARNKAFVSVYGPHTSSPSEYGKIRPWSEISAVFPEGTAVTVYDLYSNAIFSMTRVGGTNNAEVTPTSENDKNLFVNMCGGAPTWEKRPVKVSIGEEVYAGAIFCSLNKTGDNEYGTTRIYFSGSTSDIFGIPDTEMNTAVMKAGGEIKS